jgi:Cof subfamily protein (haloacid dehalogenase superfamily)
MKAVVTDLDGTLLRSDKSISKRTLDIINKLDTIGIKFVIATARAPRSVFQLLPFDFSNMYVICYNGAEIYKGNKLIYYKYIEPFEVKKIIDWILINFPGTNISLEMNNQLYSTFDISIMKGWTPPYWKVDFNAFNYEPAAKILVDLSSMIEIKALVNMLPKDCNIVITDGGQLGQIAHIDVSKLNGVKCLADLIEINISDIAAFGDDFNDIEMIKECGIGVAMGNAPLDVKKAANVIAATNDEDGVALELEKMISSWKYR